MSRTPARTQRLIATHGNESAFVPADNLESFVASLRAPRVVIIMVQAGSATEAVIDQLSPVLDPGDIIVDAGNTFYRDTQRREEALRERGIHFVGMGVSGGEEGAVLIDSSEREPLPSLPELEARVGDGPEALAALAALARGEHLLQVESERLTPRLFAGLTYGYGDEPLSTTSEERHVYSQLSGRLGVSFPLLGTWTRQKIERMRADLARTESLYRSELARYNNCIALQKAYAVLWIEQRRRPILETH